MNNNITKKQTDIIELIYRFRFLSRWQIQRLLNHKQPNRINQWLKEMTEGKIINRNYSKKLGNNIKPAIYYLATKSKNYLKDKLEKDNQLMKRIYGEKKRSAKFINHCLLSADFYLNLKKNYSAEQIFFYTKTDLLNYDYLPTNHPDAYVAIKKDKKIKRYFFEIIDDDMPKFILRTKIKQYLEYYESQVWQINTHHPFPKILILCPDETIKKYLHSYIPRIMTEENQDKIDFYLSTQPSAKWIKSEND